MKLRQLFNRMFHKSIFIYACSRNISVSFLVHVIKGLNSTLTSWIVNTKNIAIDDIIFLHERIFVLIITNICIFIKFNNGSQIYRYWFIFQLQIHKEFVVQTLLCVKSFFRFFLKGILKQIQCRWIFPKSWKREINTTDFILLQHFPKTLTCEGAFPC